MILVRFDLRFRFLGEMFSLVHAEATGTAAKAVSLGAILACMTHLAEQLTFMLRAVGGVQKFVAHSCIQNGKTSE
jgi:hypothetical protein